jgi:hypothetical protein
VELTPGRFAELLKTIAIAAAVHPQAGCNGLQPFATRLAAIPERATGATVQVRTIRS